MRVARHDAVYEGAREHAGVRQEAPEIPGKAKSFRRCTDRAFERHAVLLDELTREHDQAPLRVAVEVAEPRVQELRELTGKRSGRTRVEPIRWVGANAGLRRVGDDE